MSLYTSSFVKNVVQNIFVTFVGEEQELALEEVEPNDFLTWSETSRWGAREEKSVRIDISEPLAYCVASMMFSIDLKDVSESDARDALTELASMSAGNIRGVMRSIAGERESSGTISVCLSVSGPAVLGDSKNQLIAVALTESANTQEARNSL